jgi:hypothetical protein
MKEIGFYVVVVRLLLAALAAAFVAGAVGMAYTAIRSAAAFADFLAAADATGVVLAIAGILFGTAAAITAAAAGIALVQMIAGDDL